MKIKVSLLITASVLLTVIASAQENKKKPSASLQPPSEFTEHNYSPTSTSPKPTTKHTTTSTKPTTTPAKHTNSTTKPPTTKHTSTTAKTTATPPVPGPTPDTNATVSSYSCSNGETNYFMALMLLQIRVNDSKTGGVFIVQNKTKPTCPVNNDTMTLSLTFTEGDIVFVFQRNKTSKAVYVNSLRLNLTYAFKKGAGKTYTADNKTLELFKATIGHSYSCSNESIFLGNNIFLDVSHNRIQAFNITNNQFGQVDLCKADQPDYTVAIAVGIVLLILIIIVILAYACSRRRRTDGYQSL